MIITHRFLNVNLLGGVRIRIGRNVESDQWIFNVRWLVSETNVSNGFSETRKRLHSCRHNQFHLD